MEAVLQSYDAKIDGKKRLTLRKSNYEYYHVEEYADGSIVLKPRILVPPFEISENTLNMMDAAITNLKAGITSDPIDVSKFGGK